VKALVSSAFTKARDLQSLVTNWAIAGAGFEPATSAVAREIPGVVFELLGAQSLLGVAGEDRFDRGFLVHLVDDDDPGPVPPGPR